MWTKTDYAKAQRRYLQTPKGRAAQKRYRTSTKGRNAAAHYRQTPKGRAIGKRYRSGTKGRAAIAQSRKRHGKEGRAKERASHRVLILSFKNVPCMDCGDRFHPVCMDFDHRPGEEKLFTIAARKMGRNVVLAEIAKCDVVCANCHRVRTHVLRKRKRKPKSKVSQKRHLRSARTVWCTGFGEQLVAALGAIDMKKSQFAEALGVSRPTVSGWANGTFPMAPNHIKPASKILGVNVKTIVGWLHTSLLKELGGSATSRRRTVAFMGNASA